MLPRCEAGRALVSSTWAGWQLPCPDMGECLLLVTMDDGVAQEMFFCVPHMNVLDRSGATTHHPIGQARDEPAPGL